MRRAIMIVGIIFAVIVITVIGLLIAVPIENDSIAGRTAEELRQIELPEKTAYIESFSMAGKLTGSGNGMQYLGGILVRSSLSLEALKSFYSQYAENKWECIVEQQTGQNIRAVEHGTISLNTAIDSEDYYIVYSWGSSDSDHSDLDIRGH